MARFGLVVLAVIMLFQPKGVLAVANITLLLMSLAWVASVGIGAPLALAMLGSALFALSLVAANRVGGREYWLKEVKRLTRQYHDGHRLGLFRQCYRSDCTIGP
jgi:hypothetical protein